MGGWAKGDGTVGPATHSIVGVALGDLDVGAELETQVFVADAWFTFDDGGGADKFGNSFRVWEHVEPVVDDLYQTTDHESCPSLEREPMDCFTEGLFRGADGTFYNGDVLIGGTNLQVRGDVLPDAFEFLVGMDISDLEAAFVV